MKRPARRRSGSAAARVYLSSNFLPASAGAVCRLWAFHIPMMPGKRLKGNLDPSRLPAAPDRGSVRDRYAAGRGDRVALRDSVDAGDWRAAAARLGLARGKPDCNSAARDHSARRERKLHGIGCRSKPVAGAPPRPEPPCALGGGARQRRRFRGNVKPASVGGRKRVAIAEPRRFRRRGSTRFPPSSANIPSATLRMTGQMIRAFGADEVARLRLLSKKLRF